jgi:hypothetical protein
MNEGQRDTQGKLFALQNAEYQRKVDGNKICRADKTINSPHYHLPADPSENPSKTHKRKDLSPKKHKKPKRTETTMICQFGQQILPKPKNHKLLIYLI